MNDNNPIQTYNSLDTGLQSPEMRDLESRGRNSAMPTYLAALAITVALGLAQQGCIQNLNQPVAPSKEYCPVPDTTQGYSGIKGVRKGSMCHKKQKDHIHWHDRSGQAKRN